MSKSQGRRLQRSYYSLKAVPGSKRGTPRTASRGEGTLAHSREGL